MPHGCPLSARYLLDARYGRIANTSCRVVDNTLERLVVVGVEDDTEVGNHVAHILMIQERHALIYAVGYAATCQRRLEQTVLLVCAVEYGKVAPRGTLTRPILNIHSHLNGLVAILQHAHKAYLLATLSCRETPLLQATRVVRDERVGRLDDCLRRAIVLLELVDTRRGIIPLERQYILNLGTTEGIDALSIVAHDTYIRVLQCQASHDDILRHVGILILIHKDILKLLLVALRDLGGITQEDVRLQQQVVEVHRTITLAARTVLVVYITHFGHLSLAILTHKHRIGNIGTGGDEAVLGHRYTRSHSLGFIALLGEVFILDDALNEVFNIVRFVYRIALGEAYARGILPKDAGKDRVERAHTYIAGTRAYQRLDTLAHLACRLVRKRKGKNRGGIYALRQHIRYARRKHTCLTRAGTCDDKRGPLVV